MRRGGGLVVRALVAGVLATQAQSAFGQGLGGQSDNVVDARIRASANAAESYQGPLDGAWTLVAADGGKGLYDFQLVDKAGAVAPLEGVWRDLRRPDAPGDINAIDSLERGPQSLSIAFAAASGQPKVTIELKSDAAGTWTGNMLEAGVLIRVRLRRE